MIVLEEQHEVHSETPLSDPETPMDPVTPRTPPKSPREVQETVEVEPLLDPAIELLKEVWQFFRCS